MLSVEELRDRLNRQRSAKRRMSLQQPVRRRIVSTTYTDRAASHHLSCGHDVAAVHGAIEFAWCRQCGIERARLAGVV